MNNQNIVPITAAAFNQQANQIIPIPGFRKGSDPIYIQIRTTGVMNMLANGRIPNTLLGKVTELFGDTSKVSKDSVPLESITSDQKAEALAKLSKSDTGLQDMAELLRVFASAAMVSPTYEEVKDSMTDDQLMAVFSAMYGEVQEVESFRNEP